VWLFDFQENGMNKIVNKVGTLWIFKIFFLNFNSNIAQACSLYSDGFGHLEILGLSEIWKQIYYLN